MTAIKPTDSALRDKIDSDGYNSSLNEIKCKIFRNGQIY